MKDKTTIAVLSRTNRSLALVEQLLSDSGIKYHYVGRSGFYQQPEVKAVLSYLGCSVHLTDWNLAGAIRAPFWPTKYLPKTKLCSRLKELRTEGTSYWSLLNHEKHSLVEPKNVGALEEFTRYVGSLRRVSNLSAAEALKWMIISLKAVDYLAEEASEDNDPIENLNQLQKLAARKGSIQEFLDYTRKAAAAARGKKGVALSTVHAAKGLEWHTVYVVGCQEGLMPHAKATDLDEEKNIFYVACSRAEHELYISYAGLPSPFIGHLVTKEQP